MKVCLINLYDLDPPRNGGLSRVAHVVSNLMAQWAEEGRVQVYFAVGWRFSDEFRNWLGHSGGEIIPVMPEAGITPILKNLKPDLVLSPLFGMKPIVDWEPYRKIPHIVSIPDALALDKPELFQPAEAKRTREIYMQLRQATVVVAISEDSRERLIRHIGLKRTRVEVIPLAGDLPVQNEITEGRARALVGYSPYILYPARNWPHKRHSLLFSIMREIAPVRSDIKLVLTGWHDEGYLDMLTARHNFPREKVLDLGYVSNADMVSLYRNAEALMFVSEYEGFGMPILEAMENGCPVICAPLTSIPEVAGKAALFVNSADPRDWSRAFFKELPQQRENMIREGFRQSEKFSWEKTRELWKGVLKPYLKPTKSSKAISLPYSQEIQVWASQHSTDQEELIKKEKAIQSLSDGSRDLRIANHKLQTANRRLQVESRKLKAENYNLQTHVVEKEKIIQNFRTSFMYRLENGPLRWLSIFPFLRRLAIWIRDIRRVFLPKVGVLEQHLPIPIWIPDQYFKTPLPETAQLPRVSIVTPSYKQGAFIERTVKSILDQGYPNLEYVVQDGGSKDETITVMQAYIPRLTHFESRRDKGQAHAINLGFSHTSGEIMAYLNSDDILLPGSLNYVADYFTRHPDVDVIYSHRVIINENDMEIGRWILPRHDNDIILWADYVPQETLFWRRNLWEKAGGQVDESFQFALDWDMLIRFREAGAKFVRVPRFLAAFRVQAAQKTSAHMFSSGMGEMRRLRNRVHQREIEWGEILRNINPYLTRSILYHKLHFMGILKY